MLLNEDYSGEVLVEERIDGGQVKQQLHAAISVDREGTCRVVPTVGLKSQGRDRSTT
jgi:hypothetical protein